MMISCSHAINQLWEYLDATVEASDRTALEEHLARCRRCCGELEFAKELRGFLASSDRGQIPADVIERLNRTLEGLGR
jgi:anti-sigma factor (TIGR02949 family)